MTNKKRRVIVTSAPVLLQVVSRYPKPTKVKKMIWRTFALAPGIAFICGGVTTGEPAIMAGMTLGGIVMGLGMLVGLDRMHSAGEYPLVFTTIGITAGPYINELWTDIASCRLIEATDLDRFTFSKSGVGKSLQLENKGFWRSTNGRMGSIFPLLGYFFDEKQEQAAKQIFAEFGINCRN